MIDRDYYQRFQTRKYRDAGCLRRFMIERFLRKLQDIFREALPAGSVLDAGCGEGFVAGYLAQQFPGVRFTCLDTNADHLNQLTSRLPSVTICQGSIYELCELGLGAPDVVLCCEVLEHLVNPQAAVEQLARLGARTAIITVPHEPWFRLSNLATGKNWRRLGNDPEHAQRFSKSALQSLLERHFEIDRIETSYPWILVRCSSAARRALA